MRQPLPATAMREALLDCLPTRTDEVPERHFLVLPDRHSSALKPDRDLVVGARGVGKSVWWSVLANDDTRRSLESEWPWLADYGRVTPGFGQKVDPQHHPSRDLLQKLVERGFEPRLIWKTIALSHVAPIGSLQGDWLARVERISQEPEFAEGLLERAERALREQGKIHLVIFDALDRSASSWPLMRRLVRGLMELLVEFRTLEGLRLKAFLRPDLLASQEVFAFPDSSKLRTNEIWLDWPRRELYNLLWQRLGNSRRGGADFREHCKNCFGLNWHHDGVDFRIPERLKREEELQRQIFHALTGDWMGRDARRGFPYTWLPNHLGDAMGKVTPRSFLASLREAAEESETKASDYALHFEAIKTGVQRASRIRVQEMREDYPWMDQVFRPLARLAVPTSFAEIEARWKESGLPEGLDSAPGKEDRPIPVPARFERGLSGLRQDLEELGLFQSLTDGRINIPDVYRVGFGMLRRGGVKPVR